MDGHQLTGLFMYLLEDYDYTLPESLIAQVPAKERHNSRLLCLDKNSGAVSHEPFHHILKCLRPSDLLVVNNTKVIPGRLLGKKETGGRIEVLILNFGEVSQNNNLENAPVFKCLIKASKQAKPGTRLFFQQDLTAEVLGFENGIYQVRFNSDKQFDQVLNRIGKMPLPPYIRRDDASDNPDDRISYQTVYAREKGAIAAPTAGLHFSEPMLAKIREKGITIAPITLHVGYGTFVPVRVDDIRDHKMHSELYTISKQTADAVNLARKNKNRVIAVGTTSVRTLEYASSPGGLLSPGSGNCDLFIYPGYEFKVVDAMITNFHLPKSTLLMLVSAFAGKKKILEAYASAIQEKYRFFSYGDAMFIS